MASHRHAMQAVRLPHSLSTVRLSVILSEQCHRFRAHVIGITLASDIPFNNNLGGIEKIRSELALKR